MEEFETFVENLELKLESIFNKNAYLTLVIGDFDGKSHNWYKGNKTTAGESKLEILKSHSSSSCIAKSCFYISANYGSI